MDFGWALTYLKLGYKLHRKGWNGWGMFIYYVPGGNFPARTAIEQAEFGNTVPYLPYIAMKTVQGDVVPWLASQTDMLASDWEI